MLAKIWGRETWHIVWMDQIIQNFSKSHIYHLTGITTTHYYPIFFKKKNPKKPELIMSYIDYCHEHFVLVPDDTANNNIVYHSKSYYHNCILNELEFTLASGNPIYTRSNLKWNSSKSPSNTFNISKNQDQFELHVPLDSKIAEKSLQTKIQCWFQ
jgi:hypothetical protein